MLLILIVPIITFTACGSYQDAYETELQGYLDQGKFVEAYQLIENPDITRYIRDDKKQAATKIIYDGFMENNKFHNSLIVAVKFKLGAEYIDISATKAYEFYINKQKYKEALKIAKEHLSDELIITAAKAIYDQTEKLDDKSLLNLKDIIHYDKW